MSAGLRFYTNQGALMIDSSYANIALAEKVYKPVTERSGVVEGNSIYNYYYSGNQPILVFPLSATYYAGIYSGVWSSARNRYESIIVTNGNSDLNLFVFDRPKAISSSGAALRIYSDINGEKVFDSRLKYLKVIGVASEGMSVPVDAEWGLLIRERQIRVEPVYTDPGTARGYLFIFVNSWDIYEGKLRKRLMIVYSEYYNNLGNAPVIVTDPIRNIEPLIINLKNY